MLLSLWVVAALVVPAFSKGGGQRRDQLDQNNDGSDAQGMRSSDMFRNINDPCQFKADDAACEADSTCSIGLLSGGKANGGFDIVEACVGDCRSFFGVCVMFGGGGELDQCIQQAIDQADDDDADAETCAACFANFRAENGRRRLRGGQNGGPRQSGRQEETCRSKCLDNTSEEDCAGADLACVWHVRTNMFGNDSGQGSRGNRGRCLPEREVINTGLKITLSFFVDSDCSEALDVNRDDQGIDPRQVERLQNNEVTRIAQVDMGDGSGPPCSWAGRNDQRRGVLRKTICVEDNVLQNIIYSDPECTEEVAESPQRVRGDCMPIPAIGGSSMRRPNGQNGNGRPNGGNGNGGGNRRRLLGSGSSGGQGGQGQQNGQNGQNRDSRRRDAPSIECEDGSLTSEGDAESDFEEDLTCLEQGDDSANTNPCRGLPDSDCENETGCEMQKGYCVWTAAPDGQKQLYAIFEWSTLTEDGVDTDREFCYCDGEDCGAAGGGTQFDLINSQEAYLAVCVNADETTCEPLGCKIKTNNGQCVTKSKVSCKDLGKGLYNDDITAMQALCDSYDGPIEACVWDADKEKCGGNAIFVESE